jgi:hypothetical protein
MTSALSMQIAHSLWQWMNGETSSPPSSPPQRYSSSPTLSSTSSPSLSPSSSPRSNFRQFRPQMHSRHSSSSSASSIPSIKIHSPEDVDMESRPLMDSKVRVQQGRRQGPRKARGSPPVIHRRWGSSDSEGEGLGLGLGKRVRFA